MKIIIAGTRTCEDIKHLYNGLKASGINCDLLTEVISGKAKGADTLGETYAKLFDIQIKSFPADWNQYGKGAGFIRNQDMANYCFTEDILLALWDGQSKGTLDMISKAKKKSMKVYIWNYIENNC